MFFLDLENYNSSHAPLYIVQGNKNQDLFKFTMNLPYEINVYKNMSIRVIRLYLFLEYDKRFSAEPLKIVLLLRCHSTFSKTIRKLHLNSVQGKNIFRTWKKFKDRNFSAE